MVAKGSVLLSLSHQRIMKFSALLIRYCVAGVLCLSLSPLLAQKNRTIPYNGQAVELIAKGMDYIKSNDYRAALKVFETVAKYPLNQSTTIAVYMAGVCNLKLNDVYFAEQRFTEIVQQYPLSQYAREARYHLNLIRVQGSNESKRILGLNDFLEQEATEKDSALLYTIKQAVHHYLYTSSTTFLQQYYASVPTKYRLHVLEPLCYKLVQERRELEAKTYYKSFITAGNQPSEMLKNLFRETVTVRQVQRQVVKIGLCLPLFLQDAYIDSTHRMLPKSEPGIAFYEGFQEALNEYESEGSRKILVKVFDTQRDTTVVQNMLPEIEAFDPDLLVGPIYSPQAQILSNWSESHSTALLIPMSPKRALVEGKRHVFLANPSLEVHGATMARHAILGLGLRKMVVVTDETSNTDQMANAFLSESGLFGADIQRLTISSDYKTAAKQISQMVSSLHNQGIQGIYLPISNEESMGLFVSLLDRSMPGVRVMAAPYWQDFSALDRETTERLKVLYTTAYTTQNDTAFYNNFYKNHIKTYHLPPNEYHVQGYDLGKYILKVADLYKSDIYPIASFFRNYPLFSAAHLSYEFRNSQENQHVHVMEIRRGGEIVKVN